jgi:hypothetical protein
LGSFAKASKGIDEEFRIFVIAALKWWSRKALADFIAERGDQSFRFAVMLELGLVEGVSILTASVAPIVFLKRRVNLNRDLGG